MATKKPMGPTALEAAILEAVLVNDKPCAVCEETHGTRPDISFWELGEGDESIVLCDEDFFA